jgi:hypothetical protein
LPRKDRLDLQTEIRSTIEDMLEDRSQQSGKPVDETLISEVLQEYGAPAKVAASYKPTRYLIGPRMYPFFEMVVKIVLSVLTVLALIGFAINFVTNGPTSPAFLSNLGNYGLQYLTGIISAFGNIVLVFAILERVQPSSNFDDETEKWTPADLNAEHDPDEVNRAELIGEILFTTLGLALFNLYPNLIGFGMLKEGTWVFIPALSQTFFHYLPWINILGVLQILLDLYLLRQGIWQTATRLFNLAVEIAGIILACIMFIGPSLVSLNAEKMTEVLGASASTLTGMFNYLPQMVLIILIILETIEVLQFIWHLLKQRSGGKMILPGIRS